jgi:hypothetical protein
LVSSIFRENARERTHKETCELMMKAHQSKKTIKGVKGFSPLIAFDNFNLVWGFTIDYMHTVCLGCMKHLFSIWFSKNFNCFIDGIDAMVEIESVLNSIVTPKKISRKPGNISNYCKWKANEFRNFLFFYGIASLQNVLKTEYFENFKLFSESMYIFCKEEITEY